MEQQIFIKYIEMLHRFEKLTEEEKSIYSNTREMQVVNEVRKLVENNPDFMELLKTIHKTSDDQRIQVVNEYFQKSNQEDSKKESDILNSTNKLSISDSENEKEDNNSTSIIGSTEFGFINNILFVSIVIAVILIIVLIYFVIKYYS